MKEQKAACKFCGQVRINQYPDDFTMEQIQEDVTRHCKCKDGYVYREKKNREDRIEAAKTSAKGTTFELFHNDYPEVEELLNAAIDPLCERKIKKLSVTTGGKTKASITFTKDTLKVDREDKSTYTRETEV